ncbi:uncharacterized protein LOC127762431 isoform X2 [Oryza glaberrima]|uniref:uncharacterized protein LOC127762431 isoform X2 n=1 Tax=Oryza glaberrima TaxID=4538 RepID=UPI00224C0021|nr:uncharacterized protein LOC127762431 isoform X2 [Oryza glaberrima]
MPSPRRSSSRAKTWSWRMRRRYSEASSLRRREWSETGRPSKSWMDSPRSSSPLHLASLPRQIRRWWRRRQRPRVDPVTVAAAEDGSGGGGSFRPLSPPSHGRSNGGGGDRVWIRRRWRRPGVDPTVVAPHAADPATAAPPWHGGRRMLPSPVCWQHLPDLAISSPLARIPWFFRSLLRGSAVRCDGMVGFGDLLLSRSDPVVSLRPALADRRRRRRECPDPAVSILPAAAVSARAARTPHPVVSFFPRLERMLELLVSMLNH